MTTEKQFRFVSQDLNAISNFLCTRYGTLKSRNGELLQELWIEANLKFIELICVSVLASI
jgi:hypothetical protein